MTRCFYPENISYKNYGGRGITVCDEWKDSATFLKYLDDELGRCPQGHTLDRIDNDGNYEPGNIQWSSRADQGLNRRPRRKKLRLTQPEPRVWAIK